MKEQNYANHKRFVPLYHYISPILLLAILTGSIVNLVNSKPENLYSASLITALTVVVILLWFFSRSFALKVQDRAIRAEENLRYFVLTGKLLDKSLTMGQIISLRFAADTEFPGLVQKALAEKLSPRQVKQEINNWRADHHRA